MDVVTAIAVIGVMCERRWQTVEWVFGVDTRVIQYPRPASCDDPNCCDALEAAYLTEI
jgi:hypothetical protein